MGDVRCTKKSCFLLFYPRIKLYLHEPESTQCSTHSSISKDPSKNHLDTQKNGSNKVRQNLSRIFAAAKLNFLLDLDTSEN